MRCTSPSSRPTPSRKAIGVGHHVEGLAVALPHVDGLGVGHQPPHDHLAVAHVVFFDLGALTHAPQLQQRVLRVGLVFGLHDLGLILGLEDAELGQLRIGQEIEADQVGAAFFERRVLLLEHRGRIAAHLVRHLARRVADHLVHVGVQLAGKRAPLLGARHFARAPRRIPAAAPARWTCRRPRSRSTATPTCCRAPRAPSGRWAD